MFFFFLRRSSNVNLEDLNNVIEEEDSLGNEKSSEHFLAIIIECFAILNKIPETIEVGNDLKKKLAKF